MNTEVSRDIFKLDTKEATKGLIEWIRTWFDENGKGCNAVIGISGGKDSSVAAALCVQALGKERVIGVLMPNISQGDIGDSYDLVNHLGIRYYVIPVTMAVADTINQIAAEGIKVSSQTMLNLPPRIRMSTLYAVSQSVNGRVINTSNLSEGYIGWGTRFGDTVGDVSLFATFTASEVIEIGHELGLPEHLVNKVPSDGLSGKTDEDNFGFTYKTLDSYIRNGQLCSGEEYDKIIDMHEKSAFKRAWIPFFDAYQYIDYANESEE